MWSDVCLNPPPPCCIYTNPFSFLKIVNGLTKFRRELEVTRDEKESQEKEALQKAASLRTELTVC